ncbi:MAG: hypothetical protein KC422_00595 [Trueperaceae bacterium]|nr:hypothetical protein [Trueperaceae bacterium]
MSKSERLLAACGVSSLLLGGLGYLFFRPSHSVWFVPDWLVLGQARGLPELFYNLPALIHVFVFSLLSLAFIGLSKVKIWGVSSLWFLVNLGFELGQTLNDEALMNFPDVLRRYFLYGTFDPNDIVFAVVGAGLAISLSLFLRGKYD